MRAVGVGLLAASAVVVSAWLWLESWPSGPRRRDGVVLEVLAALLVVAWVLLVAARVRTWRTGRPGSGTVSLALTGLLAVAAVIAVEQRLPVQARFESARDDFESMLPRAEATRREAAQPVPPGEYQASSQVVGPWRLGSYEVSSYDAGPDHLQFLTSAPGVDDVTGFAHAAPGQLLETRCEYVFDLGGDWYAYGGKGCPRD
jgi:hypothetical protein